LRQTNVGSSTLFKMANKLDLADASLLGHANASKGYSLKSLIQIIGMTKSEWVKWKEKYPTKGYFSNYEIQEIDEYFGVQS
jgi:hypothetical protein